MKTNHTFLSDLLKKFHSIAEIQNHLENMVKKMPQDADKRWTLALWACLMGDWFRALKLAQNSAKLDSTYVQSAQMLRTLIKVEKQRELVFSGKAIPAQILAPRYWITQLAQALQYNAQGLVNQADELRFTALELADIWQGKTINGICSWLSDTDSRLGPVCELIISGNYYWVAMADIESLSVSSPNNLTDLLWAPAKITFKTNSIIQKDFLAFIPTRYPGTMAYIQNMMYDEKLQRAIVLGQHTRWNEVSESTVCGIGQKTWMSDLGDFSIFDVGTLTAVNNKKEI